MHMAYYVLPPHSFNLHISLTTLRYLEMGPALSCTQEGPARVYPHVCILSHEQT